MKVIVLCGGIGTRMNEYSLPKPLNMIYGTPAISYVLKELPASVSDIYFIYGKHLKKYNFEEIVINLFKTRQCHFYCVEYLTRGPVETAYIGTQSFVDSEEPIVFLDNDNIYSFPEHFFKYTSNNFLGGSVDTSGKTSYSFISHANGKIIDVVEKKRISDTYCCGVYGFKTLGEFRKYALRLLISSTKLEKNEIYMSEIYRLMLEDAVQIDFYEFKNQGNHIGSLNELNDSVASIPIPKMRICFDLDNTLVTYPQIPGDYSTVNPIHETISLVRTLHNKGHTIIIYTARRMTSHKHNVGAVLKDIGKITFDTLENFNIPYDEIIFGKPIADIYIDDRAVNPYTMKYTSMGLFYEKPSDIINKLPTNKLNTVTLASNHILKKGPSRFIRGEWHAYSSLKEFPTIQAFFPTCFSYKEDSNISELELEYVKGISFYTLFKNKLIHEKHIKDLLEMVSMFHNAPGEICITEQDVHNSNILKLQTRFNVLEDYPFENRNQVQSTILDLLSTYDDIHIVPFIHGDLWFSNIFLTFDQSIKCFDMKGRVGEVLTTNGDMLYDYAKLYQSLLGFDAALYADTIDPAYMKNIRDVFEDIVSSRGISLRRLKILTLSLMTGTFFAIESLDAKTRVWNLICNYLAQSM